MSETPKPLTPDERADLARIARAATKGPWNCDTGASIDPDGDEDIAFARGPQIQRKPGDGWHGAWRAKAKADAAHIAAANPDTVLRLLAQLDAAEQALRYVLFAADLEDDYETMESDGRFISREALLKARAALLPDPQTGDKS